MIRNSPTLETAAAAAPAADSPSLTVLAIDSGDLRLRELAGILRARGCRVLCVSEQQILEQLNNLTIPGTVVLIHGNPDVHIDTRTLAVLRNLQVPIMLLGGATQPIALPDWLYDAPAASASADEVFGRMCTLARMARYMRHMHGKLRKMRRLGRHLQANYEQIDNELLLAGQLQRNFLPRQLPTVPGLNFVALMRPYSWVSGDIYDIFRIDEDHVGMYVADAVGHGMAAGLLTMFVKQGLVAKQVTGREYRVLPPAEVLRNLNQAIAVHDLPNCQYVTICYVVVNFRTLRAQLARAAHPAPLLVDPDGQMRPIEPSPGCVVGVFPEQRFSQVEFDLLPGQKLILFSDGLEEAFGQSPQQRNRWLKILRHNAGRDIHTVFRKLQKCIDRTSGSLHPEDDITAVGLEVGTSASHE